MLYQIEAPDGSKYTFTYNVYGEVDKIVYPTGGYERFEYGVVEGVTAMNLPYMLTNRGVVKRWVSPDGTAAAEQEWRYAAEAVNPSVLKTTTVAPDGTVTDRYAHRGWLQGFGPEPGGKVFGYDDARAGMVFEECVYAPGAQHGDRGMMLHRHLTEWGGTAYVKQWVSIPGGFLINSDPRVNKEVEITLAPNGGDALTKFNDYQYDADQNVIAAADRAFVRVTHSSAQANVGQVSAINGYPAGPLLRRSESIFLVNDPDVDPAKRAEYRARNLLSLPTSVKLWDSANNVVSQSVTRYDETDYPVIACPGIIGWTDPQTYARGNATTSKTWLDTTNSWIEVHTRYDQAGNVRESKDAHFETGGSHGHLSEFVYSAAYQYAYLEQTRTPAPDPAGESGSSVPLVTTNTYDPKTGLVLTSKDANDKTTTYAYADEQGNPDPLGRLRKIERPDGGWTSYEYGNTPLDSYVRTRTSVDANRSTDSYQFFDGLGRPSRAYSYDGSAPERTWVATKTTYDRMGRAATSSNPQFRTALGDFTASSVTTSEYDYLGRVVKMTTPDGAYVTTSYVADRMTVTDQAGKARSSVTDSLGRITAVYEDPAGASYLTAYAYDALGNLTTVTQGGQTRTFDYDSLSRLLSATNPEVCQQQQSQCVPVSVTYSYDARGNVSRKTDARGVTTAYTYDALSRVTLKDYSDPTPDVSYTYDTGYKDSSNVFHEVANAKGHLTQMKSSVSAYRYTAYDVEGRATASSQVTDGQTYPMAYTYNLGGALTSQTYPSGRVVATEYDQAGRVAGAKNQATGAYYAGAAPSDANRIKYASHGAVESVRLGNGLWEHTNFNVRLQPAQIGLGSSASDSSVLRLDYAYGTLVDGSLDPTKNNGNPRSQTITAPGAASALRQEYSYDSLSRITLARETRTSDGAETWKQGYTYLDQNGQNGQFGNRRIDAANTTQNVMPADNPIISASDNRITSPGYSYDAAGNLLCDPSHPCAQSPYYAYDAENRMNSAGGGHAGGGTSYAYDGDGRRVGKTAYDGETTVYVYNVMGQKVAEYGNIQPGGGTSYLTNDALGSTRAVTDQTGRTAKARHDYLPFGEELSAGRTAQGYGVSVTGEKFTGKERDGETGLDYFVARYYSSAQGRFTGVDPSRKSAEVSIPQTWNRYSYCLNSPLKYVDKNGKWPTETHNELIRQAFPGLSSRDIGIIQRASEGVDVQYAIHLPVNIPGVGDAVGWPTTLFPGNAPKHGMTPEGWTKDAARKAAHKWIDDNADAAKTAQANYEAHGGRGLTWAALASFGQGSHTLMDMTSPAHYDFQVYSIPQQVITMPGSPLSSPLTTTMIDVAQFKKEMDEHKERESGEPTEEERRRAIANLRGYFLRVFGEEEYRKAIRPPRGK